MPLNKMGNLPSNRKEAKKHLAKAIVVKLITTEKTLDDECLEIVLGEINLCSLAHLHDLLHEK